MSKLAMFGVASLLGLGLAGAAFAADQPKPAAPAKPAATAPAKHDKASHMVAEVVSVNGQTLVVKESVKGQAKEVTLTVDPAAKITAGGKPAKLEDLKAGDSVTVKYTKSGDAMLVHQVVVHKAKK